MNFEKVWEHKGFICFIIKNHPFDTFNGYVVIPCNHVWYEKHYDSIDVDVHGGLTFSGKMGDEWVIGFDTIHDHDSYGPNALPELKKISLLFPNNTYKDEKFVMNEVEKIVSQAVHVDSVEDRKENSKNTDAQIAKLLLTLEV